MLFRSSGGYTSADPDPGHRSRLPVAWWGGQRYGRRAYSCAADAALTLSLPSLSSFRDAVPGAGSFSGRVGPDPAVCAAEHPGPSPHTRLIPIGVLPGSWPRSGNATNCQLRNTLVVRRRGVERRRWRYAGTQLGPGRHVRDLNRDLALVNGAPPGTPTSRIRAATLDSAGELPPGAVSWPYGRRKRMSGCSLAQASPSNTSRTWATA